MTAKFLRPTSLSLAFAFVSAFVSASAFAAGLSVPIPEGGALRLDVPEGWKATHEGAGPTVSVRLTSPGEESFLMLLTTLPMQPGSTPTTPAGFKDLVTSMGEQGLKDAEQTTLDLTPLRNPNGDGYSYHLTDKSPEKGPGDYREAHQGALMLGSTMISFTLLTHTGDTQNVELGLKLLNSVAIATSK
jgi:hypothetical protein